LEQDGNDPNNLTDTLNRFDVHNSINEAFRDIAMTFPEKLLAEATTSEVVEVDVVPSDMGRIFLRVFGVSTLLDGEPMLTIPYYFGTMRNINHYDFYHPAAVIKGSEITFYPHENVHVTENAEIVGIEDTTLSPGGNIPLDTALRSALVSYATARSAMIDQYDRELAEAEYAYYNSQKSMAFKGGLEE
jgi:hypothetical protein